MWLVAALAALLLAPSMAAAAPPWSAPVVVADGTPLAGAPRVLYRRAGGGEVLWTSGPGLQAAVLGAGGSPQALRRVAPAGDGVAFPDMAAGRRFVFVRARYPSAGTILSTGTAGAPGEAFALQRLPIGGGTVFAAVADGDRGGAIVIAPLGGHGRVLLASRAGTSRRYRRPLAISRRGDLHAVAAAANERGDVLAVWERSGRIEGRFRFASGRLGPLLRLGRADSLVRRIDVALGDDRRAVVAWLDQYVSEGEAMSRARIVAAARSARRGFGPATLLERFPDREIAGGVGVRAAIAGQRGIVAWTGRHAARASLVSGRAFGARQDLGPLPDRSYDRGGGLFDLAATPGGAALAVWLEPAPGSFAGTVRAATLTAAAPAFGPAEAVSDPLRPVMQPSAGIDPLDGTSVVAWSEPATTLDGRDRIVLAARPAP